MRAKQTLACQALEKMTDMDWIKAGETWTSAPWSSDCICACLGPLSLVTKSIGFLLFLWQHSLSRGATALWTGSGANLPYLQRAGSKSETLWTSLNPRTSFLGEGMDLGPTGWDWGLYGWKTSGRTLRQEAGKMGISLSCQSMKTEPCLREVSPDASGMCHCNPIVWSSHSVWTI